MRLASVLLPDPVPGEQGHEVVLRVDWGWPGLRGVPVCALASSLLTSRAGGLGLPTLLAFFPFHT